MLTPHPNALPQLFANNLAPIVDTPTEDAYNTLMHRTSRAAERKNTMSNTNTIADRIIENLMGGNGCARATRLGVKVSKLCTRIAQSRTRDNLANVYGYTFADGSELECHGNGWDTPEGWASHA